MIASIFIIVCSMGLLVYWFRYTCRLLLAEQKAEAVPSSGVFAFPRTRAQLRAGIAEAELHRALDRDYRALTYLCGKLGLLSAPDAQLLVWDYRLMRCWYAVARTAFPIQARAALEEMADVLAALAGKLEDVPAQAG